VVKIGVHNYTEVIATLKLGYRFLGHPFYRLLLLVNWFWDSKRTSCRPTCRGDYLRQTAGCVCVQVHHRK